MLSLHLDVIAEMTALFILRGGCFREMLRQCTLVNLVYGSLFSEQGNELLGFSVICISTRLIFVTSLVFPLCSSNNFYNFVTGNHVILSRSSIFS